MNTRNHNYAHTPAPLRAVRLENPAHYGTVDWLIVKDMPRSNQPCQPHPWERIIARLQTDDEETRANALLFAAAPAMASALLHLCAYAAQHTRNGCTEAEGAIIDKAQRDGTPLQAMVDRARALLAGLEAPELNNPLCGGDTPILPGSRYDTR